MRFDRHLTAFKPVLIIDQWKHGIIPTSVWERSDCQRLEMAQQQLATLDTRIGNLTSLRRLDLSGNQLQTLPASFAQLQQLEELQLADNAFSTFPEILCQLPRLRVLQLRGNAIEQLPESIGQLRHLEVLDLGYLPLRELPTGMKQLVRLNILSISSRSWIAFPKVLLQLPQLLPNFMRFDNLSISPTQVGFLYKILKQLSQQATTPAIKKAAYEAAYALLFEEGQAAISRPVLLTLLALDKQPWRKKLASYITRQSTPPTAQSHVVLLGKPDKLDLTRLNNAPWAATIGAATHAIVGRKIPLSALQQLSETTVLWSEFKARAYYDPLQSVDFIDENYENLRTMLLSGQVGNIILALQWLENSVLLPRLTTELLVGYLRLTPEEKAACRSGCIKAFERCFEEFEDRYLPPVNTPVIDRKIEKYHLERVLNSIENGPFGIRYPWLKRCSVLVGSGGLI